MIVLEGNQLKKSVKDQLLFEAHQLRIYRGDRIGLVGRNGSGKTTLLAVLAGEISVDEGVITTDSTRYLLPQLKRLDRVKSGGEITQEYINKALAEKPDILFADEPTTNLDTEHVERLESMLDRFNGAVVIVSHDRAFLDKLCTKIWQIEEQKVTEFKGNYRSYREQKEQMNRQHEAAYDHYSKKKKHLETAIKAKEQRAQRATKKPKDGTDIANTKPYFAKKQKKLQKTAKALEKRVDQLEVVEKPKQPTTIKMNIPNEEAIVGRSVIRVNQHTVEAGNRMLFTTPSVACKGGEKIAVIGKNGVGKTTLLKQLVQGHEEVTISPAVKMGYFSQNLDILQVNHSILENVQSTSIYQEDLVRTVLARLHFYSDDVHKPVQVLSGGERVKVAFAKVFLGDLNVLIMDEPTNYLDIEAVEALESLLKDYKGTVIFVSHDRRLIDNVATRVVEIKDGKLSVFEGDYQVFTRHTHLPERDDQEDELLVIETKLSEVLSKLSLEPTKELDEEWHRLVALKRKVSKK
ncbi:Vga family ABC-F type ribosomal protection protein [Jeotgalibacillus marinus]|uniref:Vga family ABC-F type ribosomal protection protein n=1 Tax=Jeotgalibacillus marinus TaxID=86667 RepID=A0ABV3Q6A9_9BACL